MKQGMLRRGNLLSALLALAGVLLWSAIQAASIQTGDLAPLNQPDGELNAGDIVIMQRLIFDQLQPTQEQSLAADVAPLNQPDGQINAGDLVVLMRAVAGQITLPLINIPSGGFAPPSLIPPNNQTQQSSLTAYGTASPLQSINFYANGTLVASLTADSLGNFQFTVSLQEGPNSFYAVGLIGAFESPPSNLVSVFYDTALPLVDWQQVALTDLGGGQIQLVAQPGTVAAGNTVTLTSKSGGTQTVTAAADGSFTATLEGSGSNEPITISVDDNAGRHSSASANQAVGALSGTFLVNEAGSATYAIPIEVPTGVSGMQPELSLNYSSQNGNGLLGVGWGLSGLSVITRCPQTYAQDAIYDGVSYDSNDRFCLDGQRLVNVAGSYGADGTVYRTEVESFSLITQNGDSCGGPCGFTVQTKSGQTMVYGNSDNSRRNVPTTSAALNWAINSITDITGNLLQFTYYKNTAGDFRIKKIAYQQRNVEFIYQTRTDTSRGYIAGTLVTNTQLLQTIRTSIGTQTVKEYRLSYALSAITAVSRIEAIQECAFAPDNASQCTPPTSFQWAERSTVQLSNATLATFSTATTNSTWVGDFDGDGRQEHAALSGALDNITITGIENGIVTFKDWPVTGTWNNAGYIWSGDFNGDGLMDIASRSGTSISMRLSNGNGFDSTDWNLPDNNWGASDDTWAADFNGDGRTDIASASGATVYLRLSNGSGFDSEQWTLADGTWGNSSFTWVGDFNGDGLSDLASASGTDVYVRLSTSNGFTSTIWAVPGILNQWGDGGNTWAKDVNGDGITDLLTVAEKNELDPDYGILVPVAYVNVMESTGSGFVLNSYRMDTVRSASRYNYLEDINADGLMDLIIGFGNLGQTGVSEVRLGLRAGGFGARFAWNGWDPGNDPNRNTYLFADFDGDGLLDSSPYIPFDSYSTGRFALSSANRDAVTAVTPGVGSKLNITYKMLSEGYTSTTCPDYPVQCGPITMQVVSDHYVEDGIGGTAQFSYSFSGVRMHSRGRGFLGFQSRNIFDSQNGVSTTTSYAVDTSEMLVDTYPDRYPYAGMASGMSSYQQVVQNPAPPPPPGRVRIASTTVLAFQAYDSMDVTAFSLKQTAPGVYFPYARVKQEEQREVSGGVLSTTTTTTDFDTSGNVTQITAQTVGNSETFIKTTVNQYDSADLRLGRLTRASVTTTTPDGTATRTSGFTYYPNGLLRQEIIEPDEPDTSSLKQVTDYEYDPFGNKTKILVTALASDDPASGLQTRTTETQYDSNGLFPVSSTNALGHTETYQYDPRLSVRTQLTGPNQLTTYWEYDVLGRLVREIRADGTASTTDYAWCPSTICLNGSGTKVTKETYGSPHAVVYRDAQDRVIRNETEGLRPGALIYQDIEYDQYGRTSRRSRTYYAGDLPQWTTYAYDQLDRLIEEYRPDGGQVVYAYAPFTKTTTAYIVGGDVAQIAKTETFDAMGRLRQVDEELGVTTTFQYDPYDNLTTVTDDAGNVTTTQHDRRGRKIFMSDPGMGQWNYRYNGFGELTFQQDNKLQQINLAYDPLGRMVSRTEPEGTTTWLYDTATTGIGKLAQVTSPNSFTRTMNYDALGRIASDVRLITGQTFQTAYAYDSLGRVTDTTYPSGFTTSNIYDPRGVLTEVRNAANDALYWQANDADADGQVTRETYGNNLQTIRTYDQTSGRIDMITTGMGTGSGTQFLDYTFDTAGNLQTRARSEGTTNLSESFDYDALNRLKVVSISGFGNKNYAYDSLGNITQKGTVSDYRYAERNAGPHAVSYANGQNYDYDTNGNMVSGAGRTLSWSSYNKPTQIQKGQTTVQFDYGPNRARFRQVKTTGSETTTTVYIGKLYEQTSKASITERKHFIIAGGRAIAIYTDKGAGQTSNQYLHHDHLGSVDVITDETGATIDRLSFAAFGSRRNIDWSDATGLITSQFTTRGFTGHEQLDEVGLIHMNGRVYDPTLGRFLSADPNVQFPASSQSHNRYSYVLNNPLAYTDPSGFFLHKKFIDHFKRIGSAIKKAFKNPIFRAFVGIVASYFTFGYVGLLTSNGLFGAAAAGFVGGLISTGTLKGAVIGAATGAAFYGVGNYFQYAAKLKGAASWSDGQLWFGKIVAHGTVGGASSVAQGGRFQDGFRSAGFTQFAAPVVGSVPGGTAGRTAAAAVVGGTASKLGGGKFANGAQTGAFSYLFNEAQHPKKKVIAATGEVSVATVGYRGAEVGSIKLSLTVDAYNSDGSSVGYYSVELSGTLGGGTLRSISPLPASVAVFDVLLKGPELTTRSDIFDAFDGQTVNINSFTASAGPAGFSVGGFSIGNYSDPNVFVPVRGLALGYSVIGGKVNVDQIRFRPTFP